MSKWLAIVFGILLLVLFTPALAEDDTCSAKRIVERIDSAYQGYLQTRTALYAVKALEKATLFYDDIGKILEDCRRVVDSSDSSVEQTVELRPVYEGRDGRSSSTRTMKNGCKVSYVEREHDIPVILMFLLGDKSLREIKNYDVYDSDVEPLEAYTEVERESNGRLEFYAAYLNPKHGETYLVRYEYKERLYEVKFLYERGITGKRNIAGYVLIEC